MTQPFSSKPTHVLNGYAAWPLSEHTHLPFDQVWLSRSGANPRPHRILPSGEPSIAVRRRYLADESAPQCDIVVCCQYTVGTWYNPLPFEELIAVRLKLENAAASLAIDLIEYVDHDPLPAPTWLISKLQTSLQLANSGAAASEVANSLLQELARAARPKPDHRNFAYAVNLLRSSHGQISISDLANRADMNPRTLQRHFVDHFGVTPKFFARRLRLNRAALMADNRLEVFWADIAAASGFHDQAHLINEYQSLIGLTPGSSHRERLGLSDFSN